MVTTWMKLAIRDRIEPEAPETEEADDDEVSGATEITDSDADRLTKD